MPVSRRTLLIAALAAPPAVAAAQPATPVDLDIAMADHVAWVVSLFAGGADDLTPAAVAARFDANFLRLVPPDELIATIRQLAGQLGPIELVEDQSTAPGEFVGVFRSDSGAGVMISIALDPKSGRIAGFFITPAALPEASPVASPEASPAAAAPLALEPAEQIARYDALLESIRAVGEPVVAATLAGDDEALAPYLSQEVEAAMGSLRSADVIASYTTQQVAMTFAEAGARFFGQWTGDEIAGVMVQNGAPFPFTLTAETPQAGDLPDGRWSGTLTTIGLELAVAFAADTAGDLTATLDIPQQGVRDVALSDVSYHAEQPVGDLEAVRAFAPGGVNNSYTVDYAWGDARLRAAVGVDLDADKVTSLLIFPSVPVPPDASPPAPLVAERLPFDGTWWVFWGGETELQNYHVAAPSQRYAYDLVIWKDGATWRGDGTDNADYWAWSRPVLAPAAGEVTRAVNDNEDLPPNTALADRIAAIEPGGNHVEIRVSDTEYVMIAHMRHGSVRVRPGDRVESGDVLGLVGNSGNSSEPHIHIHAQQAPMIEDTRARGIPLRFAGILVDGEETEDAMPVQGSFVSNA